MNKALNSQEPVVRQEVVDIEPRLVAVEVIVKSLTDNLKILTLDIKDLANAMRSKSLETDHQIQEISRITDQRLQEMTKAVTLASAPKRIEWQALIGLIVLLMAVGAATLSPIYMKINDLENANYKHAEKLDAHLAIPMHQVGETKVNAMQEKFEMQLKLITDKLVESSHNLEVKVEDVKQNGSPITRERLAVLELQMKELHEKKP